MDSLSPPHYGHPQRIIKISFFTAFYYFLRTFQSHRVYSASWPTYSPSNNTVYMWWTTCLCFSRQSRHSLMFIPDKTIRLWYIKLYIFLFYLVFFLAACIRITGHRIITTCRMLFTYIYCASQTVFLTLAQCGWIPLNNTKSLCVEGEKGFRSERDKANPSTLRHKSRASCTWYSSCFSGSILLMEYGRRPACSPQVSAPVVYILYLISVMNRATCPECTPTLGQCRPGSTPWPCRG